MPIHLPITHIIPQIRQRGLARRRRPPALLLHVLLLARQAERLRDEDADVLARVDGVELAVNVQGQGGGVVGRGAHEPRDAVVGGVDGLGDGEGVFVELGVDGGHFGCRMRLNMDGARVAVMWSSLQVLAEVDNIGCDLSTISSNF